MKRLAKKFEKVVEKNNIKLNRKLEKLQTQI